MENSFRSRITLGDKLKDETFILKVLHGKMQGFQPVTAGDVGEPQLVFFGGIPTNPFEILVNRSPRCKDWSPSTTCCQWG